MDLNTNTVLITGASGWLGMNLVHALVNGLKDCDAYRIPQTDLKIRCLIPATLDATRLRSFSESLTTLEGDIRNVSDVQRFCHQQKGAVLFHLAGVIHPKRVSEFNEINVMGTENVIKAAIGGGIRRVVVMSSNSPCGCNPHPDHQFDEESAYHPYMGYGQSKMVMEQSVERLTQQAEIESVILRAPWFYGPFQPDRQTLFFKMIREGKFPIVGDGMNLRSMVYIDNLCQGLLLAATQGPAQASKYWIADKHPYSMNEIAATVERLLSEEFHLPCSLRRLRLPGLMSEVAGWADAMIQGVGYYHQKIHVLSEMNKTIVCLISKAERELGYNPRVELEEGMRRSITSLIDLKVAI